MRDVRKKEKLIYDYEIPNNILKIFERVFNI